LAFQVRDDLLDLTADERAFGKTKGGDIIEGKRSYLVVKAMDMFTELSDTEQILLRKVQGGAARLSDIAKVEKMFRERGILETAENDMMRLTSEGKQALAPLPDGEFKNGLLLFSENLLGREI
jgi:geranylgeranyl diphosphate synthase type II